MSLEETQWQQWSELLKNWEETGSKNSKLVRHLTRQGVPEHLRGMAWQLLSNSINSELKEKYPVLITVSHAHIHYHTNVRGILIIEVGLVITWCRVR